MVTLLTSDIHLTDNPRDSYRWNLFDWIETQILERNIEQVIICGDLTDAKDRHNSNLVNRFVDCLTKLVKQQCNIYILKGNHDYIEETNPFFRFINSIQNVRFIIAPHQCRLRLGTEFKKCLFLPSVRDWKSEWKEIEFNDYDTIFCHATFEGCKVENDSILTGGIPPSIFNDCDGEVFSGDIHVPQILGKIEYIGSPYRIDFGDKFNPRVILFENSQKNLYFPCTNKHLLVIGSISDLERYKSKVKKSDQVKVRVLLRKSEYPEWKPLKQEIKEYCDNINWELYGPELVIVSDNTNKVETSKEEFKYQSSEEILKEFVSVKRVDKDLVEVGLDIIKKVS